MFCPLGSFSADANNNAAKKGAHLPEIQVSNFCDDFEMPPLETMSPFDFMNQPLKEDVFFMGSINSLQTKQNSFNLPCKLGTKSAIMVQKWSKKCFKNRSIGK